jgi:hypothetical protein
VFDDRRLWIRLDHLVQAGERKRGLAIINRTWHSNQVRELVSDNGVTLADSTRRWRSADGHLALGKGKAPSARRRSRRDRWVKLKRLRLDEATVLRFG